MKLISNDVHLGSIDVSCIKDMSSLFREYHFKNFSGIETCDVSKVENMNEMFWGTKSFEQNLDKWNTENLKHKEDMFKESLLENNPPVWYKK